MLPFQQDKKVSRFFIRDQVNLLIYTKPQVRFANKSMTENRLPLII